jgi:UMP-CMP kinase
VPAEPEKVTIFFVLGGPGSGKGTNSLKLVNEYGFVHLSAGDLLRAERDSGSPNGDLINNIIKEGQIVPVKITVNLIKAAIEKAGGATKKYLIDGFPRNQDNLDGWYEVMGAITNVEFVLFLDCDE